MKEYGAYTPGALIERLRANGYAFFYKGKVFCAYKKGRALKQGGAGKSGKPFALFIIRKSVTIPARPFLYIDGRDAAYLFDLITSGIRQALRRQQGGGKA
jgi:hypothetical protein